MPSVIEIMRAKMQQVNTNSKNDDISTESPIQKETISGPEVVPKDDFIVGNVKIDANTSIIANDEPVVESSITEDDKPPVELSTIEDDNIKKKRRRSKKSESNVIDEIEKMTDKSDTTESAEKNIVYATANKIHVESDLVPVPASESAISDNLQLKQSFDFNGVHWTPHKYKIGDMVWVPVDEQVTNDSMYDPIKVVLKKVPKKFTVATVSITNKVCYTFKETSKIIAHEKFVCDTKEQCEEICKEFN